MVTNARLYVEQPEHVDLPYGLLSAATERANTDPHWRAGVTWLSMCAGGGTTFDSCITSSPTASGTGNKADNINRDFRGATPFGVYAEVDCSPVAFYDDSEETARRALEISESYLVERVLWSGVVESAPGIGVVNANYPRLAANAGFNDPNSISTIILQTASTTVTGTAVNAAEGLGLLEQQIAACFNGVGVIHVPRTLAPTLFALNLLVVEGNSLYTKSGNRVALGAGYANTGPDGAAAPLGQAWMYATGPVFFYRSAPRLIAPPNQSINRTNNTVKAIAERVYVIGYDCCLASVLVNKRSIIATSTAG